MADRGVGVGLDVVSAGNPALDRILGGGIPARSLVIVAGEPGSGKTVLALQALFGLAAAGERVLYFTTLSEPAMKLVRYMQAFAFFDEGLIGERVSFVDLGPVLGADGPTAAIARIVERTEAESPSLVVVDSFKAIQDLAADPGEARALAYDLAVHLPALGATSLLLGEYTGDELATRPEFAVADGVLWVGARRDELASVRELEIRKLRGAAPITGRHFFEIGQGGVAVYPRVRAPEEAAEGWLPAERLTTGIDGLDALLGGGLPRGSATLVEGPTGSGKTLLGLHLLSAGARLGEPGILFTLDETPDQVRAVAAGFGMDLRGMEETGLLRIAYASPVELSTDRFLDGARRLVADVGARRVVLDGLTSLALGVPSERRFRELVYATTKHLRADGATSLMTSETPTLLGTGDAGGHGARSMVDNLILLRYVELEGRLVRSLTVVKARGVAHDSGLRQAEIGPAGFAVGPPFIDLRGVLTGVPTPER